MTAIERAADAGFATKGAGFGIARRRVFDARDNAQARGGFGGESEE